VPNVASHNNPELFGVADAPVIVARRNERTDLAVTLLQHDGPGWTLGAGEGSACLYIRGAGEAHDGSTTLQVLASVTGKRVCGTPS